MLTAEMLTIIVTLCTPSTSVNHIATAEKAAKSCAADLILCVENREDKDPGGFDRMRSLSICIKEGI